MGSPYYFDQALARAAVDYFPRWLRLTTAEWAGRPFELLPWQKHHTEQIFGWRRRDNGTRRYRRVRGWVSKKGGKSEWFAGIGHLLTVADNEPGAEVFSHATDKAQASIIWGKAKRMVELDVIQRGRLRLPGDFARLYEVSATSLFCPHLMSAFKPLSGDPTGKHGPSVHGALGDEAWEWKDGLLHRHLIDGMSARRQPLDATFSSAGVINTYGHQLYEESMAILADPSIDPETYVFAYGVDKDADWTSPDVWAKANPSFPVTPKREFLESLCREAQRNPRIENEFRQFYCGQWTEQATRWFPMHLWPELTRDKDDAQLWKKLPDELRGRLAFGGLDLASISDITALIWVFHPHRKDGRIPIVCRFWCPQATIDARDHPTRPYKQWKRMGALTATPGSVTDYGFIEKQIQEDAERFKVARDNADDFSLAVDRWNATQVVVNLRNEGLPVALFGQGFASMSAPSKELERLFLSRQLEHGNHPVLKWMFGNAVFARDPAGNIKPDKENASEKIDGVTATVMATAMKSGGVKESNLDDFLSNPVIIRA
jgi:phage terminase large subunit-like protein